jgi:hypothetical protein
MRIGKKILALFLTLAVIVGMAPAMAFAAEGYTDVPASHWANGVISKWSGDGYGVLLGDGGGAFAPSRGITLGELATIISKTFGYTERVSVNVTPSWADEAVEKAVAAGVIASSASIDASAAVTREAAIRYIAIAYGVAPVAGETSFADNSAIGSEYKPYVNAFRRLGYIVGKGENRFDPKGYYTRAEAMQVLNSTTSEIADSSITGRNFAKDLIVRKSGVTIKDTAVQGDLIIGQGVGNGEVTLDNVNISGSLLANGGGSNSVTIKGGNKIASTVANKPYGSPLHLSGNFGSITVTSGTKAIITGTVTRIIILDKAEVTLNGVKVSLIDVNGSNVKIVANSGSEVETVSVNANNTVISGVGKVKNVTVNEGAASGIEVLTSPTTIKVSAKAGAVKTQYNGTIQPGRTVTTSSGTSADGVVYYPPSYTAPNSNPTSGPTASPTGRPIAPSASPTQAPSGPTVSPSVSPAVSPTAAPTEAPTPTEAPSEPAEETPDSPFLNPDDESSGEVSREQWISRLVASAELSMFNTSIDSSYSDISEDNTYSWPIEIALQNNAISISDFEDNQFYPERAATEAFAVVTAVRALGFAYEDLADCYEIANDCGIYSGTPQTSNLTSSQASSILQAVEAVVAPVEIASEPRAVIDVADSLVELPSASYSIERFETPLANGATARVLLSGIDESQLTIGEIVILPASVENPAGLAQKILSYQPVVGGFEIYSIDPPVEDLLDDGNFEIEGEFAAEGENLFVSPTLEEELEADTNDNWSVEVVYDVASPGALTPVEDPEDLLDGNDPVTSSSGLMARARTYASNDADASNNAGASNNADASNDADTSNDADDDDADALSKLKITVGPQSVTVEISRDLVEGISASFSTELAYPRVEARVELNKILGIPVGIDEFYVALINSVELSASVEGELDIDRVRLATLTIPTSLPAVTVDVALYLNVDITGTLSLNYELENTVGMQYISGHVRSFNSQTSSLNVTLSGELNAGPQLAAELKLFGILLTDLTAKFGLGASGELTPRVQPAVSCLDVNVWLYLSLAAQDDEDGLIYRITGETLELEIFNSSFSPIKEDIHFEGTVIPWSMSIVPECTFGEGTIVGVVRDSETLAALSTFSVSAMKLGTIYNTFAYTSNGGFKIEDLPAGTYQLSISAEDYRTYAIEGVEVKVDRTTNVGTVQLVKVSDALGSASGVVTNSQTGGYLVGATVSLHEVGNTSSALHTVTTSSTGAYSFTGVETGNYTLIVSLSGYSSGSRSVIVTEAGTSNQNVTLIPISTSGDYDTSVSEGTYTQIGDLRVVLTWGASPSDLDSHLCGPTRSGADRFHVYFSSLSYSENGHVHSFLDHDDVSSYGPETTTVYDINPSGRYSFYVHDYSNGGSSNSYSLSNSDATVRVYEKEAIGETNAEGESLYRAKLIATYYVPIGVTGTLWHVFDYNAATGVLTPRTTMTVDSGSSSVGRTVSMSADAVDTDERADLETIRGSLSENK